MKQIAALWIVVVILCGGLGWSLWQQEKFHREAAAKYDDVLKFARKDAIELDRIQNQNNETQVDLVFMQGKLNDLKSEMDSLDADNMRKDIAATKSQLSLTKTVQGELIKDVFASKNDLNILETDHAELNAWCKKLSLELNSMEPAFRRLGILVVFPFKK